MEQELFSTAQIAAELEHKSKNPNRDVLNIAKRLGFTPAATRPREGKNPGGKPEMLWSREQKDAILADNRNRHKEPAQIDSPVKEPHDVSETSPADVTPERTDATAKHADCVSKSQTIEVKCVKSNLPPTLAKTAFFIDVKPAPVVEEITIAQRADRIRQLQADVQRGIIEIGNELLAAKKEVGHGNWSAWLETEFSWSDRTARRFMAVAERFGKMDNVVRFQPSILQAMLALPEGDEQEFIAAQAEAGNPVETQSARDVQKHVKEFKAARADVSAEETDDREVVSENTPAADTLPAPMDEPVTTEFKLAAIKTFETWLNYIEVLGSFVDEAQLNSLLKLFGEYWHELERHFTYEKKLACIAERILKSVKEICAQNTELAVRIKIATAELEQAQENQKK